MSIGDLVRLRHLREAKFKNAFVGTAKTFRVCTGFFFGLLLSDKVSYALASVVLPVNFILLPNSPFISRTHLLQMGFLLNDFHWIGWIQWQTKIRNEKDQMNSYVVSKHLTTQVTGNGLKFMLQWLLRFADFYESSYAMGYYQTEIMTCCRNVEIQYFFMNIFNSHVYVLVDNEIIKIH